MKKEFIPHLLALRMKTIGFKELCYTWYEPVGNWNYKITTKFGVNYNSPKYDGVISSPTWQSAFIWLIPQIKNDINEWKVCLGEEGWYIYNLADSIYHREEALEKLIEIVEQKQIKSNDETNDI
jgi:hypothetical protein